VGGLLLGLSANAQSEFDSYGCRPTGAMGFDCDARVVAAATSADGRRADFQNVGAGMLVSGGLALAAGLVWWAIAPRTQTATSLRVAFTSTRGATGFTIGVGGAL
jgi:hypothetical protein